MKTHHLSTPPNPKMKTRVLEITIVLSVLAYLIFSLRTFVPHSSSCSTNTQKNRKNSHTLVSFKLRFGTESCSVGHSAICQSSCGRHPPVLLRVVWNLQPLQAFSKWNRVINAFPFSIRYVLLWRTLLHTKFSSSCGCWWRCCGRMCTQHTLPLVLANF